MAIKLKRLKILMEQCFIRHICLFSRTARLTSYYMHKSTIVLILSVHVEVGFAKIRSGKTRSALHKCAMCSLIPPLQPLPRFPLFEECCQQRKAGQGPGNETTHAALNVNMSESESCLQ